ncbi:hypothetical protein [Patulibacter sp.]|uniref:hypothetical protein n=1 Tax=Patulibacter sp. TaxID=1912859 RepID=UPI002727BAEB|nr:hypothetical protein [Patulibacter sp.]MDO9408717.1 hypothetical protein [Patulibacter sp.]
MTASPPLLRRRPSRPALRTLAGLALIASTTGLTACGGERAEVRDASDGRPFAVSARASFAKDQRLANVEELRITVKNDDSRALPDVGIVLQGLNRSIPVADNGAGRVADPRRPVWVVDSPPSGGTTAYVGTWALGRLAPGASKTFRWQLTPTVAGKHAIRWRAVAGLDEDGPVKADAGSRTSGRLAVDVAD